MKKLLAVVFLFVAITTHAQEVGFWNKVNAFLTKPAVVDTAFVYQPKACFSLGLFSTAQKAGFDVDVNFKVKYADGTILPCVSTYSLSEDLCKKVGLDLGYGNVGFGYGLEVGPRSAQKKRSLGLNVKGKSWGVHVEYFSISNPFTTGIVIGEAGSPDYWEDQWTTEENALLKNITVDGYYVFNNKRFAYPAAYKIGLVQRRTAGSWLVTARYMQGSLYNSPEAALDTYNLLDCFSTLQASVGGGYSANFVLWHKDPTGLRDHGLRNVTLNLTAMPVITLANYLKTTSYAYDVEGHHTGDRVSKVWCYPMPNYIGSAAVSLTWDRLFFSTQFTYNRFYFRSRDVVDVSQLNVPDYVDDIGFRGVFHDWMLKGMLVYRF